MDKIRKISKTQFAFISTTTGILSLLAYDRYTATQISQHHSTRARMIAQEPTGVMDKPRRLTVYLSASTTDEGYKMKRAFERYVKPIWDESALDYEVHEGWEWYGDVRKRVHAELGGADGVDGVVSFGRPAFKGLMAGYQDYYEDHVGGYGESAVEKVVVADVDEGVGEKSVGRDRTWIEWMGWSRQENVAESRGRDELFHDLTHTRIHEDQHKNITLIPIGYIPYVVPTWFKRVYSWFDERNYVKSVGDAALVVAVGSTVTMSEMFPGDLKFNIEENERKVKKDDKDDDSNTATEPKEDLKDQTLTLTQTETENLKQSETEKNDNTETPEEEEPPIQHVIIKEELLHHLKIFYDKPQ